MTVAKHDALAGFAVAQKAHDVTTSEDQIRQVQHNDFTSRFCFDQLHSSLTFSASSRPLTVNTTVRSIVR
jgi:hypothetical protein